MSFRSVFNKAKGAFKGYYRLQSQLATYVLPLVGVDPKALKPSASLLKVMGLNDWQIANFDKWSKGDNGPASGGLMPTSTAVNAVLGQVDKNSVNTGIIGDRVTNTDAKRSKTAGTGMGNPSNTQAKRDKTAGAKVLVDDDGKVVVDDKGDPVVVDTNGDPVVPQHSLMDLFYENQKIQPPGWVVLALIAYKLFK